MDPRQPSEQEFDQLKVFIESVAELLLELVGYLRSQRSLGTLRGQLDNLESVIEAWRGDLLEHLLDTGNEERLIGHGLNK